MTEGRRSRGQLSPLGAVALALALAGSCTCGSTAAPRGTVGRRVEVREMSMRRLEARVWRDGERRLVAPTEAEGAAMERLVGAAVEVADHGAVDLSPLAAPLAATGFVAEVWQVGPTRALALLDDAHRGGGAYFLRVAASPRAGERRVLEAPHAYHDVGTGALAATLFFTHEQGDALFTNTLHRYWAPEGPRTPRPDAPADVCQQPGSFFHAATRAILVAGPARVVQLHGFGEREGGALDAVLSRGVEDTSGPVVEAIASSLRQTGLAVARFPEEFGELGATTNEQGRLCRRLGATFVHVETSRALRRRLEEDGAFLRQVGAALWGGEP